MLSTAPLRQQTRTTRATYQRQQRGRPNKLTMLELNQKREFDHSFLSSPQPYFIRSPPANQFDHSVKTMSSALHRFFTQELSIVAEHAEVADASNEVAVSIVQDSASSLPSYRHHRQVLEEPNALRRWDSSPSLSSNSGHQIQDASPMQPRRLRDSMSNQSRLSNRPIVGTRNSPWPRPTGARGARRHSGTRFPTLMQNLDETSEA